MNQEPPTHSHKPPPIAVARGDGGGESGSWRVSAVAPLPSRKASIVVQLTLLVTVTLLGIVSILLAVGYQRVRHTLHGLINARLEAVAASRRDFVQEWVGRQRDRVEIFATRGVLRNFLEKHVAEKPEEPQRTQSQDNLDGHVRMGAALSACIVSREGLVLLSSDPAEVGLDVKADPVFQAGLYDASVGLPERVGDRFVSRLAAPTRWIDGTKGVLGVVMLSVDVTSFAEKLRDTTGLGETGEVLLGVRNNGRIDYVFPPHARDAKGVLPLVNMPAMVAATSGRELIPKHNDHASEPILAVGQPIGYGGWGLVAKIDEREVYEAVEKERTLSLKLVGLACLLGLLGAYTIARNFTRPIRRLARAAQAVAAGDLSVSVPVRSWNETGVMTTTFNEMVAALRIRIEEGKKADAEIKTEQRLLRSLIDLLPACIYVKDRESRFLAANDICAGSMGVASPLDLIEKTDADFFPAEVAAAFRADEVRVLEGESVLDKEEGFVWSDGERHIMLTTKVPRRDADGSIIGIVGIGLDITERKRIEEALRASEALLRSITDHTEDMIFVKDRELRTIFVNPAGLRANAQPPERVLGRHNAEFNADPAQAAKFLADDRRVLETRRPLTVEEVITSATGQTRVLLTTKAPRFDAEGEVIGLVGVARDITARKEAEELLRASLHEKEVLLREVHHRVKNNLQIVSSLLTLQSRRLTDLALLEVFASTRDRVRAMAAVHERLYESGDFAEIDLSVHLHKLARSLAHAYSPAGVTVQPVLQLEPVVADLNTAVPLSLIANELIINALKYGFAERHGGTLTISLRTDGTRNELCISDDGPGFPEPVDIATTRTLGLRLVRDLSRQIRGDLTIDSDASGTTVAIRWPVRVSGRETVPTHACNTYPEI